MGLHIEFNGDVRPEELNALAALIHVLGGRVPEQSVVTPPARPTALTEYFERDGTKGPPLVPPSPPAPNAAVPAPPPPPIATDMDAKGLPWDERIHSSSRERVAGDVWRKRRGVDDAIVAAVTAELLGAANPAPNAPPPPPPPPASTAPEAPVVAVAASLAPPPPPPPAPAATGGALTFPQLVAKANMARGGTGYTYDELNEMAKGLGLSEFKDLLKQPEMIVYFEALLDA